jgi:hypothetical protein
MSLSNQNRSHAEEVLVASNDVLHWGLRDELLLFCSSTLQVLCGFQLQHQCLLDLLHILDVADQVLQLLAFLFDLFAVVL